MILTSDSSSDDKPIDDSPTSRMPSAKQKWTPTRQAFDKLLEQLSPDREEAANKYQVLRTRLIRFFQWRGCSATEDCADETLDRVMGKLDQGQEVSSLTGFIVGIAKHVAQERRRADERWESLDSDVPAPMVVPPILDAEEVKRRQACFERCLAELSANSRGLIVGYYNYDPGGKIEKRKRLAAELGLQLNALRIRAHRLRKSLEQCIEDCLNRKPDQKY